jgi:hypothetical protein
VLSLAFAPCPQAEIGDAVTRIRARIAREFPVIKTSTVSLASIAPQPAVSTRPD